MSFNCGACFGETHGKPWATGPPQFGLEIVDNISFNIWDKEPYDNK
jgi:hypothetical protein